ncbi:MAG: hypothetical protein ABFC38_10865 [Methanospirillum sp.]
MRLCVIARALTVVSIALLVSYAYEVGVRGPYWPVMPHSWRTVGELGLMACAFAALVSAVIAAHCPDLTGIES